MSRFSSTATYISKSSIAASAFALVSCATGPTNLHWNLPSLEEARTRGRANFVANTCNYDGAFEWGLNEAKKGEAMNGQGLAAYCPANTKASVMAGYRAGFLSVADRRYESGAIIIVNPSR